MAMLSGLLSCIFLILFYYTSAKKNNGKIPVPPPWKASLLEDLPVSNISVPDSIKALDGAAPSFPEAPPILTTATPEMTGPKRKSKSGKKTSTTAWTENEKDLDAVTTAVPTGTAVGITTGIPGITATVPSAPLDTEPVPPQDSGCKWKMETVFEIICSGLRQFSAPLDELLSKTKQHYYDTFTVSAYDIAIMVESLSISVADGDLVLTNYALRNFFKLKSLAIIGQGESTRLFIAADAFKNLPALRHLVIVSTKIGSDLTQPLAPLRQTLETVEIDHVDMREHILAFSEFSSLKKFTINNGHLLEIPSNALSSYGASLNALNFVGNRIQKLHAKQFFRFPNLNWLNLKENKMAIIEPFAFDGLNSLEYLTLANNGLINVTAQVFRGLPHLKILDLQANPDIGLKNEDFWFFQGTAVYL